MPPLLGLMLFWFVVVLVLVLVVVVVVVTVATPGAAAATGSDDDEDDDDVFDVDTDDDAGSLLSVNVTDDVVDGDKASSFVFDITILGSCVRMLVDEEGGLLWGILLLEQQSGKK